MQRDLETNFAPIDEVILKIAVMENFTRTLGLEARERRLLLLMGCLVGILFCAYTVAKVQRDAIFLTEYGAMALPYAYVGVAIASLFFVWLEGRVARRFTRVGATRLNQYIAIGFSLLAAAVFPMARHQTAAVFYLWTGSQAMILLPHFWVLALDVWDSRRARRLFPLFSACGLLGGLLGGSIAGWLTPVVKRVGLMWILSALLIGAHLLTRSVDRHRKRLPSATDTAAAASRWEIFRRSRYIQLLAVALALSVVVATIVDFQFKYFAQRAYPDPHQLTEFLGKFYAAMNGLSLIFQVSVAGWLLRRMDLLTSTSIQPVAIMALGAWGVLGPNGRPVVLMRGVQGIFSQVLGKSSTEIYYMAVRPPERRVIKPAIDTLVERWSDAVVGVLLIVAFRLLGVGIPVLATVTVLMAAVWLVVLLGLHRQYRSAIQKALSTRWLEPEAVADSVRLPSARAALLQALRDEDERRILLALRLSEYTEHPEIVAAIRQSLSHSSPAVRATAVDLMERKGLPDLERRIEGFLRDPDESVRRAAVGYLLATSRQPTAFVRELLQGEDPALRRLALDALFDRPHLAPGAIPPQRIDEWIESGTREDRLLAARALGTLQDVAPVAPLLRLIRDPDPEIRRLALLSAIRRPRRDLLDPLLSLLLEAEWSGDARRALAAIGDPAVPALTRLLNGESGGRAQALAARTLAEIASHRAVDSLLHLARSKDRALRQLGFRNLSRVRVLRGEPVLPRALAHRMFLREMGEYQAALAPAARLQAQALPELRLLGESYREFADMALERAVRSLACWYEPRALFGVFERLRERKLGASGPALEYLNDILPRAVFRPVSRAFEEDPLEEGASRPLDPGELTEWIRAAWRTGDPWLRAMAVHVSRRAPALHESAFTIGENEGPVVRAELRARFGGEDAARLPGVEARTSSA